MDQVDEISAKIEKVVRLVDQPVNPVDQVVNHVDQIVNPINQESKQIDLTSTLPMEYLTYLLEFVPNKEPLFTVSKKLYEAACIASKSDYQFMLRGNATIQEYFANIVTSKRTFDDFNIEDIDTETLSKDQIEKLFQILQKFGDEVKWLKINCDVIAEDDLRTILSFFPNIESLSIQRDRDIKRSKPGVKLGMKKIEQLALHSLKSIAFTSSLLQFDKIFDNVQLSVNFEKLHLNLVDVTSCFKLMENNTSIREISITSPTFVPLIPINHLTLKKLSIEMPKAKSLAPLLVHQTELNYLDLDDYVDFKWRNPNDYNSDSSIESSDELNPELNVDLLMTATKLRNLTNFNVSIDEISENDIVHFSKLTQLNQLSVSSKKLNKIRILSNVSLPNITRLLLHFKKIRVPKENLEQIATNFPNVNDLTYEAEYFCDAFICFANNCDQLEKLSIIRTDDHLDDYAQFVASDGAKVKTNHRLKSITLYFSFPEERNVHNFMIRVALTAPNVENLWLHVDSMKIVPGNFIYILRSFNKLKAVNLSYDLFPDESMAGSLIKSYSDVEEYGRQMELQIIEILKIYGTRLEFVQLCLSSSLDVNESLWKETFSQQFTSIQADDMNITMKKDVNAVDWKLFA